MAKFTLKKLLIDKPPFRKLKEIEIKFADRLTLIAGHNGIGKSTILALIANGSGLRARKYRTYLGRQFLGHLNDIIHLDYKTEFSDKNDREEELPNPFLEYDMNGETLIKRCALAKRTVMSTAKKTRRLEARVVPRNHPIADFAIPGSDQVVGEAAKVPIPTIYLGMARMLPIGESDPDTVENSLDESIDHTDADFIADFVKSVIGFKNIAAKNAITTQAVKGTKKLNKHPEYPHSPRSVSLGQDSLSSIATAFASFRKIKREQGTEYPGGLLVIDELDAGFHPHAQQKLLEKIRWAAKLLEVQVVATTHSLFLIEAVHPDNNPVGGKGKYIDSVVYIMDTEKPYVADDISLREIQQDMALIAPAPSPKQKDKELKIYLEDAEADFFLKHLLTTKLKRSINSECGAKLKAIPISVGCDNLQGLQKFDSHFKKVLIVVDADATVKKGKGAPSNVVKLPGGKVQGEKGMSPERTIYEFAKTLSEDNEEYPTSRAALRKMHVTSNQLKNHLLDTNTNIKERESAKKWMRAKLDHISNWKLVPLWLEEHPEQVKAFEVELRASAIKTAKLLT
ncbi:AAA ATPase domain protein [compost metagenome]